MPSVQKVHIDKMLTNISVGYKNEAYIADTILPQVGVDKQSDKYFVYGKELFRTHDDRRAPGTEAHEITWTLSDDQYFVEGHALRHAIADEEIQNADDSYQLEVDGTELVTEGILLNKEVAAASVLLDPNTYAIDFKYSMGAASNPVKWSDFTNSDPIMDIAKAKEVMHKHSGIRPNTLIVSETVFNVLKIHPKILKLFSGISSVSILSVEQLRIALDVEKIVIGSALKSTATNPGQGDTLNYIWGNSAILCFVTPRPGKKVCSLGYTFMWNKDGNGAVQVRKWYETGRRATIIEAERWYAFKIVSNVAGFLFADAVTPLAG